MNDNHFVENFYFCCFSGASFIRINAKLVFVRQLLDVYLQQNITADVDVMANSLAKALIINMLNGIPNKSDKVFFTSCAFIVWCV